MTGPTGMVVFKNNRTNCPHCGAMSEILPGRYEMNGDQMNVELDSSISPAALSALRELIEKLQRSEITPQEAVLQASGINPSLGRLVERFLTMGIPTLALLISLISLHIQREDSKASGEFYRQAIELLERQIETTGSISKQIERSSRVKPKGDRPAKAKADKKPVTVKSPSKRRQEVSKERRRKLIEARKDFPRGR
ncbi:hypothetical protein [Mesorhizobium sp. B2-7-1]|uniref:hypothetical protein n=1 Tax=Mesorhizobium sp. B2-7-1 TaxID=2589909 RepID=UPI00112E7E15|nr:hypothetical protein [Mesorhizobium sp. B2-7-1]TPJ53219.1 hypothetical protein FJ471_27170 [Mesorhizobium sp. B2-7-1]